jgi:FkbM family methyltransferase
MWDIRCLVYEFFHKKSFQEFINDRFKDENKFIIDSKYVSHLVMKNGDLFYLSEDVGSSNSVLEEYKFDDIRKDDIVIDIGANIGGFSIPASRMSNHVYAVEPFMVKELRENISLNKRDIQVIEGALGNGDIMEVKWEGVHKQLKTMTLSDLKNYCGGCDFLKVDCEGGEWFIKPDELKGIRRIEMEVHGVGKQSFSEMGNMLKKAGFNYDYCGHRTYGGEYSTYGGEFDMVWLVHAINPNIV